MNETVVYLSDRDWEVVYAATKAKPTEEAKALYAKLKPLLEDAEVARETRRLNKGENKAAFDSFINDLVEKCNERCD